MTAWPHGGDRPSTRAHRVASCRSCSRGVRAASLRRDFFPQHPQHDRSCDEHRAVGSRDRADGHRKREAVDARPAEDVQDEGHHQHGPRREQRPTQRLVDAQVDHLARDLRTLAADFADAVEHHDRVVDRVTDDGQQSGDDRQVDLELVDQQKSQEPGEIGTDRDGAHRDQHVMHQGDHRRHDRRSRAGTEPTRK